MVQASVLCHMQSPGGKLSTMRASATHCETLDLDRTLQELVWFCVRMLKG